MNRIKRVADSNIDDDIDIAEVPMDTGEDDCFLFQFQEQKKQKNKITKTGPKLLIMYDFSMIDKKIEEVQVILQELIKLKENFAKHNDDDLPNQKGFCTYLA